MADFPAAHSMDSTWFAVDLDGHVALFDTDEAGTLPSQGFPAGGEAGGQDGMEPFELLAAALRARIATDPELAARLPSEPGAIAQLAEDGFYDLEEAAEELLRALGVFTYGCLDHSPGPYQRGSAKLLASFV